MKILTSFLLLAVSIPAMSQLDCERLDGATVISSDAAPVYLGFFGSFSAQNSIANTFSVYGSSFNDLSVRNEFGRYGSNSSDFSAQYEFATRPPRIVRDGRLLAYLSTNTNLDGPGWSLFEIETSCEFSAAQPGEMFAASASWSGLNASFQGSWFNPERDGEGLVLEFFGSGTATGLIVYFYTYDAQGNQVWLIGSTGLSANVQSPVRIEMVITKGARFGDQFDPADVQRQTWGELEIEFQSCDRGIVRWFPQLEAFETGQSEIERLVPLADGLNCL